MDNEKEEVPATERAHALIQEVMADEGLHPTHRATLDRALMFITHVQAMDDHQQAERIKVVNEFQQWLFDNWHGIHQSQKKTSLRHTKDHWFTTMTRVGLYDLASCMHAISEACHLHGFDDYNCAMENTWAEVNRIVTKKLGMPALQVPYYFG